jgi:hypothetical protein
LTGLLQDAFRNYMRHFQAICPIKLSPCKK